jgi:hypothetical protein
MKKLFVLPLIFRKFIIGGISEGVCDSFIVISLALGSKRRGGKAREQQYS